MNVEQLIAELQKLPKHLPVVFEGQECGVFDVQEIKVVPIKQNVEDGLEWVYGPHRINPCDADPAELTAAVYLPTGSYDCNCD